MHAKSVRRDAEAQGKGPYQLFTPRYLMAPNQELLDACGVTWEGYKQKSREREVERIAVRLEEGWEW